jgi:hypothetical protein
MNTLGQLLWIPSALQRLVIVTINEIRFKLMGHV